jgi:predicted signal transduction protein with EAL and GGDEF domain
VRAILTETGLEPRYLELELTETFLMQDSKSTAAVLQALKDMGVQLALDDFGTGYSSLSYLKRFPIDTLKIDRSFVCDMTTDADDASIVSAVISMGKSLHLRVVAEGVETREQLSLLRAQSCPEGQGYDFSRPVAAGEFTQLTGRSVAGVSRQESGGRRLNSQLAYFFARPTGRRRTFAAFGRRVALPSSVGAVAGADVGRLIVPLNRWRKEDRIGEGSFRR